MDLSVVLGGRDDNYGENFIPRLKQSLENNLSKLDKSGLDYEMIVVDFNPLNNQYLHKNNLLEEVSIFPSSITSIKSLVEEISKSSILEYILISVAFSKYPAGFKLLNDKVPIE